MASKRSGNSPSVWVWMWTLFVSWIPCVGFIMSLFWAFSSDARRNYFRAVLAWQLIGLFLWGGLVSLGYFPKVHKQIQAWVNDGSSDPHKVKRTKSSD